MIAKAKRRKPKRMRRYRFEGMSACDSILIGNHGSASVVARGHFNLSGTLLVLDDKVTFSVSGNGNATFSGKCREIVVSKAEGDCILDFSETKCDRFTCNMASGSVTIVVGDVRRVDILEMREEATLRISGSPMVTARSLEDNVRIVSLQHHDPPLITHPPSKWLR